MSDRSVITRFRSEDTRWPRQIFRYSEHVSLAGVSMPLNKLVGIP